MRKLIKKTPLISIALVIFAFISIVWSNQQSGMAVAESVFDEIVMLDNTKFNEENEGKLVAVYSDLQLLKAAVDPDTGLKVKCGILVKKAEMYQYTLVGDNVYRKYLGYSEKNIRGRRGENYNNTEFPEEYQNKAFLGDVRIGDGDLLLGNDLLKSLVRTNFSSESTKYQLLNPDIKIPGFNKDAEGNFTNSQGEKPEIGDIRISYHYLTLKSLGKVLVVGRQQDGEIVADKDISVISTTATNIEQLKNEMSTGNHQKTSQVLKIMAIVELAAAVVIFIISRIKSKKTGGI